MTILMDYVYNNPLVIILLSAYTNIILKTCIESLSTFKFYSFNFEIADN